VSSEQPHAAGHDDHGHGHGGSQFIQHHYDDAQHQFDSGKMGIWLFLAQEVLFFSALFVAYIIYRYHHPEIYAYAHKYLDVKFGAINTAVLIFSSLTAAWAVRAAQLNQRKLLITCLAATILCALAFLGIKYIEYTHKIHEHILFGHRFDPCVSSGNAPLLTKNNECPGHKGSVLWDDGGQKPVMGCFAEIALDQNPHRPGLQVDCEVSETVLEIPKDAKGKPVTDKRTNKWAVVAKSSTPITKQCPPPSMHAEHGEHEACWRVAPQPAVCHPGWFFTSRCTGGAMLAGAPQALAAAKQEAGAALTALNAATASKDEVRTKDAKAAVAKADAALLEAENLADLARSCSAGGASFWSSDSHASSSDCVDGRLARDKQLKNVRKQEDEKLEKEKLAIPLTTWTLSECVRSETTGFLVDHGDHKVRPFEMIVTPKCKGPPAPTNASDLFAEPERKLKLGEKLIDPSVAAPDAHDAHDQLYLGPPPEHTGMFFTIYFAMTGLHGIHVLVGVFVFIWLLIRAIKGHFTPDYFGPVDFAALYWHIVDLIWIFLFPLLYLIH